MRLSWIVIVVCLLSSCAFINGLHNQQNTSAKPDDSQNKIQSSRATTPRSNTNDQNNPSTNAAKTLTPLVQ